MSRPIVGSDESCDGVKPGSSLSRAKAGNCTIDCNSPDTLSFSAVSQIRLT